MTSCSSRATRLRSSALVLAARPACASLSWATRLSWCLISKPAAAVSAQPAIQAAQPGSGLIHSHSAANSATTLAK